MKSIKLNLKKRSYFICIEEGLLHKTGALLRKLNIGNDAIIITNPYLKKKFGATLTKSLQKSRFSCKFYCVPASEKAKSMKCCLDLIDAISRYDKGKKVFFIALGGGVVGDLTGFIASIYKRGTPYAQIPTTLLAQIDSAIGGKTAIDLKVAKNLVGAFCQPKIVIVDTSLLKTLPHRQIKSGMAEIIKYAIIKDALLFSFLKNNYRKIMALDKKTIAYIEGRCIRIKAEVVAKDEREKKGIRTILNFGHTVGHALESAAGYQKYNHGEAITIGMICASQIANRLNLLSNGDLAKIDALIQQFGLPKQIKALPINKILNALERDKKFILAKNRFFLPTKIGHVIVKKNIPQELIKDVIMRNSVRER